MILLLIIQILFGLLDGEKIVFANDSKFNIYAVQIKQNSEIVFQDTIFAKNQTEYFVSTNIPYEIKWTRITKNGEYYRFPQEYERQDCNNNIIVLKPNKMVTIHLAPQDIP
jgi:hypothetical protein